MPFVEFDGELDQQAGPGYVEFTGKLDEPEDLTKPAGALRRSIVKEPAPATVGSVLEGRPMPEPVFDAAEADRLSNRAYAESTMLPDDPRRLAPSMRQGSAPVVDANARRGESIADSSFPVRVLGKTAAGIAEGVGGAARAVGEMTGIDSLAAAGRSTAAGAKTFDAAMGEIGQVEGFGPNSPVPYLTRQAEGAASSLAQSATLAATFGPSAVIPLMSIQTAGQEYDKARQKGLDPGAALAGALPKGVFEAVGEKFSGLDRVAGAMGTLLTKGASAEAKHTAADVLVRSGIREIPGEVITFLGQSGVDVLPGIGLNPNMTMAQFLDGLRDTVVQAGMMGGAMAGGGHGVRATTPALQATAEQMARDRGFLVQPAAPTAQRAIEQIGKATSVDEAIAAAQAAVHAPGTSAVENISRILQDQGIPNVGNAGAPEPGPAAAVDAGSADIVAGLAGAGPAIADTTGTVAQLPAIDAADLPADVAAPSDQGSVAAVAPAAAPAVADLTSADPAQLLAARADPTSPYQQAADAELKRRETEAAYAQRDQQTEAQRAAIVTEARDQQGDQQIARAEAGQVEAPTAMEVALQRAEAKAGKKLEPRKEWVSFTPETGSKGIPRAEMPQIRAEHRGAMVNFLNARGITQQAAEVDPNSLKPTQAEYSPEKVLKAKQFGGTDRSILVSSDNHVLDGHHQWVAKLQAHEPVKVIRLNAPIERLMKEVREFPSADTAPGATPVRDARLTPLSKRNAQTAAPAPAPAVAASTGGADTASAAPAAPATRLVNPKLVPLSKRGKVEQSLERDIEAVFQAEAKPEQAAPKPPNPKLIPKSRREPAPAKTVDERLVPKSKRGTSFSRGDSDPVAAITRLRDGARNEIQKLAEGISAGWANAPSVVVLRNADDPRMPRDALEADESQRSQGAAGVPLGFLHGGKVYLMADQLDNRQQATEVLYHEALGHYGLRNAFPGTLERGLNEIAVTRRKEVAAKAKQYGLDMNDPDQRLDAAEEVLAELAQTKPELGVVRSAIAAIKNWLRDNVPGFGRLPMSNSDIIQKYILPARGWVERGRGRGDGVTPVREATAFSRAEKTEADAKPEPKKSVIWARDPLGRIRFAPGQQLYDWLGSGPAGKLLSRAGLKAASPEMRRQLRQMKVEVEKAQEVAVAVAKESNALSSEERELVSDLIEQEAKSGLIPPAHAVKLAKVLNTTMGAQTDELVKLGMLTKDAADQWRGRYLPRYYKSKLGPAVQDAWSSALAGLRGKPSVMKGIRGKRLRGRGLYETISPSELSDWQALGWEVRDPGFDPKTSKDVQVWRDFTRAEREKMGEIRDVGFRFVMGYMESQKDIALGRLFERLADDEAMSSRTEHEGWTQVPETKVPGTGAQRYGKLAGRWVDPDTMSQLSNVEEAQSGALQLYRKAMSYWKQGKTALNPVSHFNNVVSNLTMAHLAGVSYWDGHKYMGAIRDLATNNERVAEAKDAGLFLGGMSEVELMNALPKTLRVLAQKKDGLATWAGRSAFHVMSFGLSRPMGAAYQAEDSFFKFLLYRDARERGVEPGDAVDWAQKFIFSYDDLPSGARKIRDFAMPFFSYVYKSVPVLLHTAITRPDRLAAPAAVLWFANALAYMAAASDDEDETWMDRLQRYLNSEEYRKQVREKEELERRHLPPWMKGSTALFTPKAVRLGMDEVTKLPLFIDVSRIIPGGDLFDVSPNAGGIPIPQPITPSHPLFTTAVGMIANRDTFTGKDLVDSNDTRGEAAEKRFGWLWKQMTPAISAGNYHWQRGMNALAQANGGEVRYVPDFLGGDSTGIGRDGLPVQPKQALAQTFGVKIRPYDLDTAEQIEESQKRKMIRDIDAELRSLRRLAAKGAISDATLDKKREAALEKKDRLRDGLTVDGDKRD